MDLTFLGISHDAILTNLDSVCTSVSLIQTHLQSPWSLWGDQMQDVDLRSGAKTRGTGTDFWKCCPFNIGLFEKHKLLFSFNMTVKIEQADDRVPHEELDFFLKGNVNIFV